MLYSAIFHIGLFGITDVILNFYFVSLGYRPEDIGLLQSLPRISGLLTGLPVGILANRISSRRIMIYSSAGVAFTFGLLVIWPTLPVLALSRFLLGFFYNTQQIATSPMIVTLSEKPYQTHLFSYHNLISMISTALGSLIGGVLPTLLAGLLLPNAVTVEEVARAQTPLAYGASLAVAGLFILLSVVPLTRVRESPLAQPVTSIKRAQGNAVPWVRLLVWGLPLLLFGFSGGLTFPFYNLFFRTIFDVSDQVIGQILSLGWIGMGLVTVANPWWDRRFGPSRALGVTMTLAAMAFVGLSLAASLNLSVIAFVMAISLRNTMQPLFQPLVMDSLPSDLHNLASSIGLVLWNIGWFAATNISAFWQKTYGFGFIMQVVAVSVLITGLSVIVIFRPTRHLLRATQT